MLLSRGNRMQAEQFAETSGQCKPGQPQEGSRPKSKAVPPKVLSKYGVYLIEHAASRRQNTEDRPSHLEGTALDCMAASMMAAGLVDRTDLRLAPPRRPNSVNGRIRPPVRRGVCGRVPCGGELAAVVQGQPASSPEPCQEQAAANAERAPLRSLVRTPRVQDTTASNRPRTPALLPACAPAACHRQQASKTAGSDKLALAVEPSLPAVVNRSPVSVETVEKLSRRRPESARLAKSQSPSLEAELNATAVERQQLRHDRRLTLPISKQVSFCDKGDDIIEAFTPYSRKYGPHPAEFHFDDRGFMVPATDPATSGLDLSCVDSGTILECTSWQGVVYCNEPRSDDASAFPMLNFGDRVKVLERSGRFVRDEVGWLPMFVEYSSMFEVVEAVSPSRRQKLGTPRCGVLVPEQPAQQMSAT